MKSWEKGYEKNRDLAYEKRIIDIFQQVFAKFKNEKILLYGVGEITRILVEHVHDFKFCGLLDGVRKSGFKYNLPIWDIKEAFEKTNASIIIIAARASNTGIIMSRIKEFCQQRNIEVYDLSGRNLTKNEEVWKMPYKISLPIAENLTEKIAVSLIYPKLFHGLNGVDDRPEINKAGDFGYCIIGPLTYCHCIWLYNKIREKNINEIIFSSRDGFIIQKVFDLIVQSQKKFEKSKEIKSRYIYCSRRSYVLASLETEEDIKYAYKIAFDGTIENMLKERFGLDENDIIPFAYQDSLDEWDYLLCYKKKILRKAYEQKENLYTYFDRNKIEVTASTGFWDLISSGTCHNCLQKILNKDIYGFYLSYIYNGIQSKADISSMFTNDLGLISPYFFYNHYLVLENIYTSYEATVKAFDKSGNPIFFQESRTTAELKELQEIHQGILDFINDLLVSLNYNISDMLSLDFVDAFLRLLSNKYTNYNIKLRCLDTLVDEYCKRTLSIKEILEV